MKKSMHADFFLDDSHEIIEPLLMYTIKNDKKTLFDKILLSNFRVNKKILEENN
jgi:hypothetical protein